MTRIETSQAGIQSRQEQGFDFNTSGIRGSLGAPGLAVLPAVSSNANQFLRLSAALGLTGNVAANIGAAERRNQSRENAKTAEQQRQVEAEARAQEGLSKVHFDTDKERIKNAAANGEFDSLLSDDQDETRSNIFGWIEPQLEGHAEAYKGKSRELLSVFMSTELAKREQALLELAIEEDGELLQDAAATETTVEGIQSAVADFRELHPEATEADALNRIVLPQLQSLPKLASETENLDQLEALADRFVLLRDSLGGRLVTETQESAAAFSRSARQAKRQIQDQAINAFYRSRLVGDSFDKQREHVANSLRDNLLDEQAASHRKKSRNL